MYKKNRNCFVCKRPIPENLMAAVTEDTYICPQCVNNLQEHYNNAPEKTSEDKKERHFIIQYKDSINLLGESWAKTAFIAAEALDASGSNWEAMFDEYISLAAGMSVRLAQGDFDGDARKCFEAMWQFHAENKFNRYIGEIAGCGEDLSYEELCEILVLPRPDLEQIMELVSFIMENTK